jgi:hypothetical protein
LGSEIKLKNLTHLNCHILAARLLVKNHFGQPELAYSDILSADIWQTQCCAYSAIARANTTVNWLTSIDFYCVGKISVGRMSVGQMSVSQISFN